ncbi:hypothetical protein E5Q_01921 [Mixia osmundae IAM 14324]|uniref:SRP54-type proteins GTP-binding domain-containing protein n=1 Tax=Mixia osmundae (strain CBS 9802 / IAM 14324 / JCM 22182 / KY 12970) TaxID=764103 RepID=G7DXF5_MIXOS|nr:hypothetical protein E5Q_01921 [Mixia osmundae IAM 14324]
MELSPGALIDHASIFTKGGLVLWSRSYGSSRNPMNSLARDVLIQGRSHSSLSADEAQTWECDNLSVGYTLANEYDLILAIAHPRVIQLSYLPAFLVALKALFISMFATKLSALSNALKVNAVEALAQQLGGISLASPDWLQGWDAAFARLLQQFDKTSSRGMKATKTPGLAVASPEDSDSAPASEPDQPLDGKAISKNMAAFKTRQKGLRGGKQASRPSSRASLAGSGSDTGPESDAKRKASKVMRKWGDGVPTEEDMTALDFSSNDANGHEEIAPSGLVDSRAMGQVDRNGLYNVADYALPAAAPAEASTGGLGSLFSKLTASVGLGSRKLTAEELKPVLSTMREHLMNRNVARDVAEKICESVGQSLQGTTLSGMASVKTEVRKALEVALVRILTPRTSTDVLLEITRKRSTSIMSAPTPYVITFVGVNGVGKSTNLSKVAFWLLQNKLRVMIAACDTFRSGAVEQLRVHVNNLSKLSVQPRIDGRSSIELYERGYGKDAAGIAKDAIAYAKQEGFDVILIDTAGRMQDNEPLMRALAKLVMVNQPDKIVFVGEALVGNEAVDQLKKFNDSLRNFSNSQRGVDGIIVSKFDTVSEKVGAVLSMTYTTGAPVLFVGTGQTYSDLRSLRVQHIVQALVRTRLTARSQQGNILEAEVADVKPIATLLRSVAFHPRAIVVVTSTGLNVTVEAGRALQAHAFLQKAVFERFSFHPPTDGPSPGPLTAEDQDEIELIFEIRLTTLLQCLDIFGGAASSSAHTLLRKRAWQEEEEEGEDKPAWARETRSKTPNERDARKTAMKLSYRGVGHPLVLLLEESGVVTTCEITTFVPEEILDISFREELRVQKVIMKSEWLLNALSEAEKSCDRICFTFASAEDNPAAIRAGRPRPLFRVEALTDVGSSAEMEFPFDQDIVESFECVGMVSNTYKFDHLRFAFNALSASTKTSMRTDEEGLLSLQFMLPMSSARGRAKPSIGYAEFLCLPLSET